MPNIPTIDSPLDRFQPSNLGYAANETAGRRIGPLLHEAGLAIGSGLDTVGKTTTQIGDAIDKQDAQEEISKGIPDWELFKAQHATAYSDELKSANPNEIGQIAQKHLADLDDQIKQFSGNFSTNAGQEWAQKAVAEYKAHFIAKTFADAANGQGNAVALNVHTAVNAMAGAVTADPSMLPHQLEQVDKNIDALAATYPNLTPEAKGHIDKLKEEAKGQLAYVGIKSMMDQNPANGLAVLESGKYDKYIGLKAEELSKYADTAAKIARGDARAERQDARDALVDKDRVSREKIFNSLSTNDDGTVNYPANFGNVMLHDPSILPETKGALLNRWQQDIARGAKDLGDPATFKDFTTRMLLPEDDAKRLTHEEIIQAVPDHLLSYQQAAFLTAQLKDRKDPATDALLRNAQAEIQQELNSGRQQGAGDSAASETRALSFFWNAYTKGVQAGITPQELLNKASPNYIFKQQLDKDGRVDWKQFSNPGADAASHPANQYQKAAADAVDQAVHTTDMLRDGKPEEVNQILKDGGVNLDVRSSAWCAALVNATLAKVGIKGTGDQHAASFKEWGFGVPVWDVQKGDVFYTPSGANEGYTGHVGFVTGKTRQGRDGLQVEVVSSHLQGGSHEEGGVEWRSAKSMMFRRAKPSVPEIAAAPSRGFGNLFGFLGSTTPAREPNAADDE